MSPAETLALLEGKLEEHGLAVAGWTGGLDGAVQRFGVCRPGRRQITVSRHLAAINSEEEVLNTVLHEIAHALAFIEHGRQCGHDHRWRAIATRIGARPRRCFSGGETNTVTGSYYLVHRDTGEVFRTYYRRPRVTDLTNRWIRGRKAETAGKLVVVSAAQLDAMRRSEASDPGVVAEEEAPVHVFGHDGGGKRFKFPAEAVARLGQG